MSSAVIEHDDVAVRDDDVVRGEVVVRGERVAYAALGEASPTTVWLHGLGSEGTDLLDVARRTGAPALLVDLPGFGRSERVERDFPVGRAVEAVLGALDALGVGAPLLWVGCSYGGHVALRAALDAPARVSGLVLVDAGGLLPEPPVHLAPLFDERLMAARPPQAVMAAIDGLVARPCDATRRYRARRLASHVAQGLPASTWVARLARLAPDALPSDYVAVARSARGALQDDAGRRLEQVRCPVELVHGERDPLVPVQAALAAAARLPAAALTTLSGVGHMPWLEAPAQVAARVRRALERIHATHDPDHGQE